MKVRITTEIDLDTGAYDVQIKNLTKPGAAVDSDVLRVVWRKVYEQLSGKLRHAWEALN